MVKAIATVFGAFKSFMTWLTNLQLIEAGRDKERAEIASQGVKINEQSRKARAAVRLGADAKRLRRERYEKRKSERLLRESTTTTGE